MQAQIVDFIQLSDESLDKGLVEDDVAEVLLATLLEHLWLKEEVTLLAYLVLQVLAHEVSKESTDLELGVPLHLRVGSIIYE